MNRKEFLEAFRLDLNIMKACEDPMCELETTIEYFEMHIRQDTTPSCPLIDLVFEGYEDIDHYLEDHPTVDKRYFRATEYYSEHKYKATHGIQPNPILLKQMVKVMKTKLEGWKK